jgi:hypothetical protein
MSGRGVEDGPNIRCFPASDAEFRESVSETIARSRARVREGERLISVVQQRLAARYPRIEIHRREDLAKLGPESETWYVYRDGRIA